MTANTPKVTSNEKLKEKMIEKLAKNGINRDWMKDHLVIMLPGDSDEAEEGE